MSLVNYSSDEEEEEEEQRQLPQVSQPKPSSSSKASSAQVSASVQANFSSTVVETALKLPDASQLFASFDSVKESTVVSLSGQAASSRKRSDLNGSAEAPLNKIPKGSLMPLRIVPDTAGGSLLPPQLQGRSNIATEDLDKLFTRKAKQSINSQEEQP